MRQQRNRGRDRLRFTTKTKEKGVVGQKKRVPKTKWDIIDDLKEKRLERKQKEKNKQRKEIKKVNEEKEKERSRQERITEVER